MATADAVATYDSAGTMTSSPVPIRRARRARSSAAVPLLTAQANFRPARCAISDSNFATRGPLVSQPLFMQSITSRSSASPTAGLAQGIFSSLSRVSFTWSSLCRHPLSPGAGEIVGNEFQNPAGGGQIGESFQNRLPHPLRHLPAMLSISQEVRDFCAQFDRGFKTDAV